MLYICWKVKGKPRVETDIGLLLNLDKFKMNTHAIYVGRSRENLGLNLGLLLLLLLNLDKFKMNPSCSICWRENLGLNKALVYYYSWFFMFLIKTISEKTSIKSISIKNTIKCILIVCLIVILQNIFNIFNT